jgi:hypothetical protein
MSAAEALLRNVLLRLAGGPLLLYRYNWLYDWRAAQPGSVAREYKLPSTQTEDE